jgi:hypothetical protein
MARFGCRLPRAGTAWMAEPMPAPARFLKATMEEAMDGDNRPPEKKIGEVKYAEEQAKRTTGHQPPHGPGAPRNEEGPRAHPDRDPAKKKTGEF